MCPEIVAKYQELCEPDGIDALHLRSADCFDRRLVYKGPSTQEPQLFGRYHLFIPGWFSISLMVRG